MFPSEPGPPTPTPPPPPAGEAATSPPAPPRSLLPPPPIPAPAAGFFPPVIVRVQHPTFERFWADLWVSPPAAWWDAQQDRDGYEQMCDLLKAWSLQADDGQPVPICPDVLKQYLPDKVLEWLWVQWREHYATPLDRMNGNGSGPSTPTSTATPGAAPTTTGP